MITNIRPFIHCISKTELKPSDINYIQNFFPEDYKWKHILQAALDEGVCGLLYCNLKKINIISRIPKPALEFLENTYYEISQNTLETTSRALEIALELTKARISVLALQGLPMIRLYHDPGVRLMGDIDLLVASFDDKNRLSQILKDCGYQQDKLYPNQFSNKGFIFDIHTHILNADRIQSRHHLFPKPINALWERASLFFVPYDGLLKPDPLDHLVILCAHALKHNYSRLIWLTDIYEILRCYVRSVEDWMKLLDRIRYWQQEKTVLYALWLIKSIFGFLIPAQITESLWHLNSIERHFLRLKINGINSDALCPILWLFCKPGKMLSSLNMIFETAFPRREIMAQITCNNHVSAADYIRRTINIFMRLAKYNKKVV